MHLFRYLAYGRGFFMASLYDKIKYRDVTQGSALLVGSSGWVFGDFGDFFVM